jgi:hypothetical protein
MGRDGGQIQHGVQPAVRIRIVPAAARACSGLHAWGWAKQLGNDAACPPPPTAPTGVRVLRARRLLGIGVQVHADVGWPVAN